MGENPLALLARSSRLRRDPIPAKPAKTQTQTLRAPLSISDTGKCAQPLILSWTDYLRGLSPRRRPALWRAGGRGDGDSQSVVFMGGGCGGLLLFISAEWGGRSLKGQGGARSRS